MNNKHRAKFLEGLKKIAGRKKVNEGIIGSTLKGAAIGGVAGGLVSPALAVPGAGIGSAVGAYKGVKKAFSGRE